MSERTDTQVRVVLAITEVRPRTAEQALEALERALSARPEACRAAGVWRADAGALNQIISLWTGRDEAEVTGTSSAILSVLEIAKGIWPPPTTAEASGILFRQTSVLALPASFSPIR